VVDVSQDAQHIQDVANVTAWRTAASGPGGSVEIAFADEKVFLRDAKDRSGTVLAFSRSEWRAFLLGARAGEFDFSPGR
jgi:hypothetical protein